MVPIQLFQAHPSLEGLPIGQLKYASLEYATDSLTPLKELILQMAAGIREPRVSYTFRHLAPGGRFGHGRWHKDGREQPEEVHRLLTIGGCPTEGQGGFILHAGMVWEYSGEYLHRAVPSTMGGPRLMLRISQTEMHYRNFWNT